MTDIEEMKKVVGKYRIFTDALEKKLTLAKEQVDQTRKEKRDQSNRRT